MRERIKIEKIQTMNSREIAMLLEKQHNHVCRDIRRQLEEQDIGESKYGSSYLTEQNKEVICFNLDYEQTMILLSGYSIKLRAKVIKRWLELEKSQLPKSFSEALQLAANQAREIERKTEQIETLEIRLDENKQWYTVKKVQIMGHFAGTDPRHLWRPLKSFSINNNYEIKEIPDTNYEKVNSYHKDIWKAVYGIEL
ncbi:MAG: Rha family transcriptional regulator [Spirochaetaceae bacterium]|jgi:phage regulator Rha-like protein|nr:Rha family transcriptional regulator [Spirochaetaceae bacterium]